MIFFAAVDQDSKGLNKVLKVVAWLYFFVYLMRM